MIFKDLHQLLLLEVVDLYNVILKNNSEANKSSSWCEEVL